MEKGFREIEQTEIKDREMNEDEGEKKSEKESEEKKN